MREIKRRDCLLCGHSLAANAFPKDTATPVCTHERNTCGACMRSSVDTQLKNKNIDEITCPQCESKLDSYQCESFGYAETVQRFRKLENIAMANRQPGMRFCLEPVCDGGHIHVPNNNLNQDDIFSCELCHSFSCTRCDVPWHVGDTCEQFRTAQALRQKQQAKKGKVAKGIKKRFKKCPGCGTNVQKSDGNILRQCAACDTQFCRECLASYTQFDHGARCRHSTGHATTLAPIQDLSQATLANNFQSATADAAHQISIDTATAETGLITGPENYAPMDTVVTYPGDIEIPDSEGCFMTMEELMNDVQPVAQPTNNLPTIFSNISIEQMWLPDYPMPATNPYNDFETTLCDLHPVEQRKFRATAGNRFLDFDDGWQLPPMRAPLLPLTNLHEGYFPVSSTGLGDEAQTHHLAMTGLEFSGGTDAEDEVPMRRLMDAFIEPDAWNEGGDK